MKRIAAILFAFSLWAQPASASITFVNNVKVIGTGASSAINVSAANGSGGLFVAIIGGVSTVSPPTDSSSNTWTAATGVAGSAGGELRLYYVVNPTATASHTFTNGSSSFASMCVLAFAGVNAFDKETNIAGNGVNTTRHLPTATPTTDGTSLFVTGMGGGNGAGHSIDESFTFVEENDFAAGVNYDSASAYFIQSASGAKDPTWTNSSNFSGASMLVFSPAGGGPPATSRAPCGLRLLGVGCDEAQQ